MSTTYDDLNEVVYFDVIFIGHLASVTANMFATMTKNVYRSLVLSITLELSHRNLKINSLAFFTADKY